MLSRSATAMFLLAILFASAVLLGQEKKEQAATGPPAPPRTDTKKAANEIGKERARQTRIALRRYLSQKAGRRPLGNVVPKGYLLEWTRKQYDAAPNQTVLYALAAEHLAIADKRYFTSKDPLVRRDGLELSMYACRCADDRLKDPWLATRIAEGYLLDYLEDADHDFTGWVSTSNVLETANSAYALAKDAENMLAVHRQLLWYSHNTNVADSVRLRMAKILIAQARYDEALELLYEISPDQGVGGARLLIPETEKKRREKRIKEIRNEIKD